VIVKGERLGCLGHVEHIGMGLRQEGATYGKKADKMRWSGRGCRDVSLEVR